MDSSHTHTHTRISAMKSMLKVAFLKVSRSSPYDDDDDDDDDDNDDDDDSDDDELIY